MRKYFGWNLAFMAVLLYSINSPVARWALLAGIAPETLLAARFVFATLLFGFTMPALSLPVLKRLTPQGTSRPLDQRGILICFASGFANGLTLFLLYQGLVTLEASLSSVIMIGLIVVFTIGLLAFWGNRPRPLDLGRLLVTVFGLYLLLGPGGEVSWIGVAYTAGAAFFFSLHVVSVQLYLSEYHVWTVTALLVTAASIFAVLLWWQAGADVMIPGWVGWIAIFFQAIVATYIGRLITYAAVQYIGSDQFALLSPLETLLTIIWSVLFLQERLSAEQWIGAVTIVAGTALVVFPWRRLGLGWMINPVMAQKKDSGN